MKRWQSLGLGGVVSVLSLAYALHGVSLSLIGNALASARLIYLVPLAVFIVVGIFIRAVRWVGLLDDQLSIADSFDIINIGYLFGSLLPFRLGDVVRIYLVTQVKRPIPALAALSTILVERLLDTLAVVLITIIAVNLTTTTATVASAARASAFIALLGLAVLVWLARQRSFAMSLASYLTRTIPVLARINLAAGANRLLDGLQPIARLRGLVRAVGWSIPAWALSCLQVWIALPMFYHSPSWACALLVITFSALAVALPAVPGNIGPYEASVVTALSIAGYISPNTPELRARALAFAVTIHAATTMAFALLGWSGLLRQRVGLTRLLSNLRASRSAIDT